MLLLLSLLSMFMSSLMAAELLRGRGGGGGVRMRSSKLFQKWTPPECLIAWDVKALEERRLSREMSSGMALVLSVVMGAEGAKVGEEQKVVGCDCARGGRLISLWASPSRTCRMTSASRRTSVSMGAPSSSREAFTRANVLDFG